MNKIFVSDREFFESKYDEITDDPYIVLGMVFCNKCKREFKESDKAYIRWNNEDPARSIAHCEKCIDSMVRKREEERAKPYEGLFNVAK